MSPVETRKTNFGIPVEKWKEVPSGTVLLKEGEKEGFLSEVFGIDLRIKSIITEADSLKCEVEKLAIPRDWEFGPRQNIYTRKTVTLTADEINNHRFSIRGKRIWESHQIRVK